MCRLSLNLGASTSWNPQGLPRPIIGFLCLYVSELHFMSVSVISSFSFDLQCTVLLIKKGTIFLKKNWYIAIELVGFLVISDSPRLQRKL